MVKKSLFPSFHSETLCDPITFEGSDVSRSHLHQVREKDKKGQADLHAALKLKADVLHPGEAFQKL